MAELIYITSPRWVLQVYDYFNAAWHPTIGAAISVNFMSKGGLKDQALKIRLADIIVHKETDFSKDDSGLICSSLGKFEYTASL